MRVKVRQSSLLVTTHAITRFRERACPALTRRQAENLLRSKLRRATVASVPPSWADDPCRDDPADQWLFVSAGIVFAVRRGRVITCIVKHEVGAQARVIS